MAGVAKEEFDQLRTEVAAIKDAIKELLGRQEQDMRALAGNLRGEVLGRVNEVASNLDRLNGKLEELRESPRRRTRSGGEEELHKLSPGDLSGRSVNPFLEPFMGQGSFNSTNSKEWLKFSLKSYSGSTQDLPFMEPLKM